MDCRAYQELAAAHADGRLDPSERAAADQHVADCVRCASLRRAEEGVAVVLHQRRVVRPTPRTVRDRIDAALAGAAAADAHRMRSRRRTRLVLAGAAAAALALVVIPRLLPNPGLLRVLPADIHQAKADALPLALRTGDVSQLAAFYHARLNLSDPVADLRPAGFQPIGGTVDEVGGVPTTLTVYGGPRGTIVCRRFRAGALPLPAGGVEIGGARYFEVDGVTIRIQQFGDTICCMASTLSRDAFAEVFMMPSAHQHE